jgi:acetyl esterase
MMEEAPPFEGVCEVREESVEGADADGSWHGREVPIRIYRPPNAPSPSPALVYFHGGGWVVGSLDSHDASCHLLAQYGGFTVVSVDYRLAPESPFPAAVSDGTAAYRHVVADAERLGLDPERIAVGGDSAGGNLAAVICEVTQDDRMPPAFQLLVYPATDLSSEHPSYELFEEGFLLTAEEMRWFIKHYVADVERRSDSRISPLLSSNLKGLPPACVVIAGFDPLRDEGLAYAEKLEENGVDVTLQKHPGLFHGFWSVGHLLPPARDAIEKAAHSVRRGLDAIRTELRH